MVFSTTKNTKPRERKKWVGPNIIRAERSEREVAATAFCSETGFQYLLGTAGRAGPWHTVPFPVFGVTPKCYQPFVCHRSA